MLLIDSEDPPYKAFHEALTNDETIGNATYRAVFWLLGKKGGFIVAPEIAAGAQVAYNGTPHRRIMKDLRKLGLMTSQYCFNDQGQVDGEVLVIDMRDPPAPAGHRVDPAITRGGKTLVQHPHHGTTQPARIVDEGDNLEAPVLLI